MKNCKRILSFVVSFVMVFGMLTTQLGTAKAQEVTNKFNFGDFFKSETKKLSDVDYKRALSQKFGVEVTDDNVNPNQEKTINPYDEVRVIVEVNGPTVYEMTKGQKITPDKTANLEASVDAAQKPVLTKVKALGKIRHTYKTLFNGFSAVVKYSDIENIREMAGVKNVSVANQYYLDMNTAVNLTKAPSVWNDLGLKGEGTVVAIVDTGIDYTHKDMVLSTGTTPKLTKDDVQALGGPGKYYTDKVPYGYNFADMNDRIIPQASMHGMHVAGIVAANGKDEDVKQNLAVKGIAPEAQLLAMKVFSNNPNFASAYNDDIAAAIEDSYKHGADVINMSLGSTAGFIDYNDVEQKAIKNATDAGVVVVVSGGNSGYATKDVYYPYTIDPDMSVVGAPGLFPDTLQVASSENSYIVCSALDYKAGETSGTMAYFTSDVDPVGVLNGEYDVVDCGYGLNVNGTSYQRNDFEGKDLTGKIALIQRGLPAGAPSTVDASFITKKLNAQAAGAAGVIVYNHTSGGDGFISMATDPSIHIPAVFIGNTDGNTIKALIANGVKISFNGKLKSGLNTLGGQMSDFSSWGTAPGLEFKPEITAPGGNIYSTVNNNKYEIMSGTSMAAPHTAGATALVVQHLKTLGMNLENREFVNLAKTLLINSAEPVIDPAVKLPYLTRKQGAGLVQIDRAVKTNAYVTDASGNAVVALKEIGNTSEVTLTINNFGDKPLTFIPSSQYGVLTNKVTTNGYFNYPNAKVLTNAQVLFSKEEVTVPAKGNSTLTVSIVIPTSAPKNIFAEGFISLTEKDSLNTKLGIPFMGFYGKWSGEQGPRMFDSPAWDPYNFFGMTTLLDGDTNFLGYEGWDERNNVPIINKDEIAFSPNGDYTFDSVMPLLSFMRNAKEFEVKIVDANGKVVRDISKDINIRKNYTDRRTAYYTFNNSWAWDGTVYNEITGKYMMAPEGDYMVRVMAKPDIANAEWYTLDMPVKLDITAPIVNVKGEKLEGNNYKITLISGTDGHGIGIGEYDAFIFDKDGNPIGSELLNLDQPGSEDVIQLPGDDCYVGVVAFDYAGNYSFNELVVENNAVTIQPMNYFTAAKDVTINYTISDLLTTQVDHIGVTVDNNAEVNNEKNLSYVLPEASEGKHVVTVRLYDAANKNIGENSIVFVVDRTNPVITLDKKAGTDDVDYSIVTGDDGKEKILWKFSISDNLSGYTAEVNGNLLDQVESDGEMIENHYTYLSDLVDGNNELMINVSDPAGNRNGIDQIVNIKLSKIGIALADTDIKYVVGKTAVVSGKVTVKADEKVKEVTVDGNPVTLNEDGTFSANITVDAFGEKVVPVVATGESGETATAVANIKFTPFGFVNRNILTNSDSQAIDYTVDTTADNTISKVRISVGSTELGVKEKTDNTVTATGLVEGENTVLFEALNAEGNVIASDSVNVTVDTTIPTLEVLDNNGDEISSFDFTEKDVPVHFQPSEQLTSLTVSINGAAPIQISDLDTTLSFDEGQNRVTVDMTDLAGNHNNYQFRVWVDTTAPELTILEPATEGPVTVNDAVYTIKMSVKDNVYGYKLYVNGEQIGYDENGNGAGTDVKEYTYNYTVPAGTSTVLVKAVDQLGNTIVKKVTVVNGNDPDFTKAVIAQPTADFDKKAPQNIEVGVAFNDDKLVDMYGFNVASPMILPGMLKDVDYTVSSDKIVLNAAYLSSLPVGQYIFKFVFKSEEVPFMVNILDTRVTNPLIKGILVDGMPLDGFDVNRLNYEVEVSPLSERVPQVGYVAYDNSKVEITQAAKAGEAAIIKLTAEDGTVKIYTVKFVVPLIIEKTSTATEYAAGSDARIVVKATNVSEKDRPATLIVGLYDENGKMVQLVMGGYMIQANGSVDMSAFIKLPANAANYKIKAFVWDSFEGMNPLSSVIECIVK